MTGPVPAMIVGIPARPGAKPRDVVVSLANVDEIIADLESARRAMLAAAFELEEDADDPGHGNSAAALIDESIRTGRPVLVDDDDDLGHGNSRQDEAVTALLPGGAEAQEARRDDTWVKGGTSGRVSPVAEAVAGMTIISPCPSLSVTGPCARLNGHPMPHRTVSGGEWDSAPQCPAGLLRDGGDWADACRRDAGHEPPHKSEHNGDWDGSHPRHVADLNAHDFSAAVIEESIRTGQPVIVDEDERAEPWTLVTLTPREPEYPDVSGGGVAYAVADSLAAAPATPARPTTWMMCGDSLEDDYVHAPGSPAECPRHGQTYFISEAEWLARVPPEHGGCMEVGCCHTEGAHTKAVRVGGVVRVIGCRECDCGRYVAPDSDGMAVPPPDGEDRGAYWERHQAAAAALASVPGAGLDGDDGELPRGFVPLASERLRGARIGGRA